MSQAVMQAANEAVFQRQLNTYHAVKYVVRETGVNSAVAQEAVRQTVTWHKK